MIAIEFRLPGLSPLAQPRGPTELVEFHGVTAEIGSSAPKTVFRESPGAVFQLNIDRGCPQGVEPVHRSYFRLPLSASGIRSAMRHFSPAASFSTVATVRCLSELATEDTPS
jgi:hypothetical protein